MRAKSCSFALRSDASTLSHNSAISERSFSSSICSAPSARWISQVRCSAATPSVRQASSSISVEATNCCSTSTMISALAASSPVTNSCCSSTCTLASRSFVFCSASSTEAFAADCMACHANASSIVGSLRCCASSSSKACSALSCSKPQTIRRWVPNFIFQAASSSLVRVARRRISSFRAFICRCRQIVLVKCAMRIRRVASSLRSRDRIRVSS
mmetsp:Transcript_3721/g.7122  ORF Transcript_3721/g.7122 Transcript_3721/m.7122 type:complete len:214 (+) Transcript_3721:942-1583(+)